MPHPVHELHEVAEELHRLQRLIVDILLNPQIELDLAMAALDDLKALGTRIDAVTAELPTTIADAVSAAEASAETALEAEVATLTTSVTALEAAAKGSASTPPAGVLTLGAFPAVTSGVAVSETISVTGGTAPYTFAPATLPAGLSIDSTGLVTGTPTDASGTAEPAFTLGVTDSSSPALDGSQSYTITIG
jgi:hypothetical protein